MYPEVQTTGTPEIDSWSVEDFDFSVTPSLLLDDLAEKEKRQIEYAIRRGELMADEAGPPSIGGLMAAKECHRNNNNEVSSHRLFPCRLPFRAIVAILVVAFLASIALILSSSCAIGTCDSVSTSKTNRGAGTAQGKSLTIAPSNVQAVARSPTGAPGEDQGQFLNPTSNGATVTPTLTGEHTRVNATNHETPTLQPSRKESTYYIPTKSPNIPRHPIPYLTTESATSQPWTNYPLPTHLPTTFPSFKPTTTKPSSAPTGNKQTTLLPTGSTTASFSSTNQLYEAIDAYLVDSSESSTVAHTFGHPIGSWDVHHIEDFSSAFNAIRNPAVANFNEPIGTWDTRSAVTMNEIFRSAVSFNQPLPWNTSQVTSMRGMFRDCTNFNGDVSLWDMRNVKYLDGVFQATPSFRGTDLGNWNVQAVVSMKNAFASASSFNTDLSSWDVSKVTDLSGMFQHAASFDSDVSSWTVTTAKDMNKMFYGAASFTSDISSWDVTNVHNFTRMLAGATSFNRSLCGWKSALSGAATNMMFLATNCPITNDHLEPTSTAICHACSDNLVVQEPPSRIKSTVPRKFTSTSDLYRAVDIYLADLLRGEFSIANQFFPIELWDVSNITDFSKVFSAQRNPLAIIFNADISNWYVSNAKTMACMFEEAFLFSGNLSFWQVGNVQDMSGMFQYAVSFRGTGLAKWNVQSVQRASGMFRGAVSSLLMLDEEDDDNISGWNVSSFRNMSHMFAGAIGFDQTLCPWQEQMMHSEVVMDGMFAGTACAAIETTTSVLLMTDEQPSFCHVCM